MKRIQSIIKILSLSILLLGQVVLGGNEKRVKGLKSSNIAVGSEIFLEDYRYQEMLFNPNYVNTYYQDYAHIHVKLHDENNELAHYSQDWTFSVTYELKLKNASGVESTVTETIDLSYVQASAYYDQMINKHIDQDYYSATLKVLNVTSSGTPISSIRLDLELDVERTYVLDEDDIPVLSIKNSSLYGFSGPDKDNLDVRWTPIQGAESYDLEWLFLDYPELPTGLESSHYPIAGTSVSVSDLNIDFRNATRLRLLGNTYDFTLNYPRGYVLYRVRTVGKDKDGNNITGPWTVSATTSDLTSGNSPDKFIAYKGNSSPMNWQYTAVYAENGKRKEVVSYLDGSLRSRQSLSILNTERNVVVTQGLYDREGRSVVSVLPSVVSGSSLDYRTGLNKNSNGDNYSWSDFDQGSSILTPETMSPSSAGAGKYYSSSNNISTIGKDEIPDAGGYPFSRVILSDDGLNRPIRSSGYGEALKIGSDQDVETMYLSPAGSEELDKVFGTEVGVTGYTKRMIIDQNEQIHIEYYNQDNQMIASTIVADFEGAKNLHTLDTSVYPLMDIQAIESDLLETGNVLTGVTWESANVVSPEITNTYRFNYELLSTQFNAYVCDDPIFSPSPTVPYDLLIYIVDQDGDYVDLNLSNGSVDTIISLSHQDTLSLSFTAEFELLNTYYITKKLIIDSAEINNAVVNQLNNLSFLCNWNIEEPHLIFGCVMNCMFDNGYVPVYDMQGSILHYKNDTDPSDIIELTDALHNSCLQIVDCDTNVFSESLSMCNIKQNLMLEAMRTDGEYFENTAFSNTISYDSEGWLNANAPMSTSAPLLAFQTAFGGDWSLFKEAVSVFESNGNSFIGYPIYQSNASIMSFFSNWDNESWKTTLFRMHPEYDVYFCQCTPLIVEGNGGYFCEVDYPSFDAFYPDFYSVDNDIDALANGSFNPFGLQQTLTIPPANYLHHSPTTPLVISEIWNTGFNVVTAPLNYLVDSFLVHGARFYSNGSPTIYRPLHENGYVEKVYTSLSTITTLNGSPVSVWDILEKSFAMSPTSGFTSSISALDISSNGTLKMILGPNGPLNPLSSTFTSSSRIDYFRSQYYLYRELHWYDRIRDRSNALTTGNPYYFDQEASDFTIMFPDHHIYNDVLSGIDPTLAFQIDSLTDCTEQAEEWATNIVHSLRGGTLPAGLYDEFNAYQDLIDQYPILYNSSSTSDYQLAVNYINAETQLINDLKAEFISKECHVYNGQSTSFLTSPITSSTFEIEISANASNPSSFVISPTSGSGGNDTVIAFGYPMSSVLNTIGTGPSYPNYDPDDLASCGCDNYESYLVANNLTSSTDAIIAQNLLTEGIISDLSEYSSHWTTYCNLSTTNVLDYLLASGFPEYFHCVPYPYLLQYNQDYIIAYNQYETDYLQYQLDSLAMYGSLAGYLLDSVVEESLDAVYEDFTMIQPPTMFHYTLYYYDQAGNLMKTVPPKGVASTYDFDTIDSLRDHKLEHHVPEHDYITNYQYNSLNQLTQKTTPDGGKTKFWYDELGRLILSQNAQQQAENKFSYVLYDQLSRTIEAGQVNPTNVPLDDSRDLSTKSIKLLGSFTEDYSMLTPFYIWLQMNPREEYTQSVYDRILSSTFLNNYFPREDGGFGQENLRLRISSITYKRFSENGSLMADYTTIDEIYNLISAQQSGGNVNIIGLVNKMQTDDWINVGYDNGSHYTYDIHGNVKRMVQQNLDYFTLGNTYKTIDYEYDLISGNIDEVVYQKGASDQFSHRYYYDADNRLTEVETSRDMDIWDTQAKYFYYAHGPLARVEIGDKQVQANDYAYTLQGWLKSVNSASLNTADDPGMDGDESLAHTHRSFAQDVFGYNLHYFDGDYESISSNENQVLTYNPSSPLGGLEPYRNLYNGNITSMVTSIEGPGAQSTRYSYDQLNRLKTMDVYEPTSNNLDNHVGMDQSNHTFNYKSSYSYDPDGNLLSLRRKNESNVLIDDFDYSYYQDGVNNTNRLQRVEDGTADGVSSLGTNDFEDDIFSGLNMFTYDALGNLKRDELEEIADIDWGVHGKVLSITREAGSKKSDLVFEYDALGSRLSKLEKTKDANGNLEIQSQWKKTIYVRDASGNVMATYKGEAGNPVYKVKDFHIYGSERLGLLNENISSLTDAQSTEQKRMLGRTRYELKNHLGNVLATITDVKRSELTGNIVTYHSEVESYSDYYPFGMQMPGRKFNGGDYKYGFNGMENDNELKGDGNSVDFGARMYDPRLGRFFALDPRIKDFPYWSPYLFAANNPIRFIDVNGEGPGDRVKKALNFLGIPYKQQLKTSLRVNNDDAALEYMDCSELVCRVLASDGLTPKIKHMNTSALIKFFSDTKKYHKSEIPTEGDIVLWKGHTGVVKGYDSETKKVTVIHATKYGNVSSVVEEKYPMSYYEKKGAFFYRPLNEKVDPRIFKLNNEIKGLQGGANLNQGYLDMYKKMLSDNDLSDSHHFNDRVKYYQKEVDEYKGKIKEKQEEIKENGGTGWRPNHTSSDYVPVTQRK